MKVNKLAAATIGLFGVAGGLVLAGALTGSPDQGSVRIEQAGVEQAVEPTVEPTAEPTVVVAEPAPAPVVVADPVPVAPVGTVEPVTPKPESKPAPAQQAPRNADAPPANIDMGPPPAVDLGGGAPGGSGLNPQP